MSILDTRDLDSELDELQERADLADEALNDEESDADDVIDDDERERLAALVSLRDEIGSEWRHGVALIPESDFEDYARELAEDIYGQDACQSLPVDWSRWADAVQSDYTCIEFDGETFYYRS